MIDEKTTIKNEARNAVQRLFTTAIEAERAGTFNGFSAGDLQSVRSYYLNFKKEETFNDKHPVIAGVVAIWVWMVMTGNVVSDPFDILNLNLATFTGFMLAKVASQMQRSKRNYIASMLGVIQIPDMKQSSIFYIELIRFHVFGGKEKSAVEVKKGLIVFAIFSALAVAFFFHPQKELISLSALFALVVTFFQFVEE